MKKIVKIALIASMFSFISCSKEVVEPQVIEKEVLVEVFVQDPSSSSLVESLRLYYFGDEIKIYEDSQRLAGANGEVSYDIYQEAKDSGTNFVTGEFNLTSDGTEFSTIAYKVSINMNNKSCEIIEATKDGSILTTMNLILLLGSW